MEEIKSWPNMSFEEVNGIARISCDRCRMIIWSGHASDVTGINEATQIHFETIACEPVVYT